MIRVRNARPQWPRGFRSPSCAAFAAQRKRRRRGIRYGTGNSQRISKHEQLARGPGGRNSLAVELDGPRQEWATTPAGLGISVLPDRFLPGRGGSSPRTPVPSFA
jgi:hypothetical protein